MSMLTDSSANIEAQLQAEPAESFLSLRHLLAPPRANLSTGKEEVLFSIVRWLTERLTR
jgi:hypothetical protein